MRTIPSSARRGRGCARSPSVPRTARIGEVRPARRAGMKRAEDRGQEPGGDGRDRRPPGEDQLADGEVQRRARARRARRRARSRGRARARRPARPSSAASRRTEPVIRAPRRPERPQHPDLARALEHGHVEGVEDQEAADEQGHRGEEVEDRVERLELGLDVVGLRLRRLDLDALAEALLQPALDRGDRRPAPPPTITSISSNARGLSITLRAGSSAIAAKPSPPNSKPLENWNRPTTSNRRSPSGVASEIRSPTADVVRVRPALLERDLAAALGLAPGDGLRVGDVGGVGILAGDVELRSPASGGAVPVALDQREDADDPADRLVDARASARPCRSAAAGSESSPLPETTRSARP